MCRRYNNQKLKLFVEKDKIRVQGQGKRLGIYWDMEHVRKKFLGKLPALIYVLADRRMEEGIEYFHFNEAYFLAGFDFELFKKMVKSDDIMVDLRMYYRPDGTVRNHGTGFRVKIKKLYQCFEVKEGLI